MPRPTISPEESIPIINSYCNERHDGKLVCVMDPVKGRTLYATRPFVVGELILEEPPLHAVRLDPENALCARLMDLCDRQSFKHPAIWYWCALNSVLVEGDSPIDGLQAITRRQWDLLRILFIPHAVKPSSEATSLVDCMGLRGIVADIDMEIMIQVWLYNCFEHQRDPEGFVIYFMPSFCSHSCLPNALWCTDDDSNFQFFPRATIRAGDEITLTYLSEEDMLCSTSHRRDLLEGAKYFKCMCERCLSPVDFSRGFRCPNCRTGVIYAHADETGSKHAFNGALLIEPESREPEPVSNEAGPTCDSPSESPIPDERGPDTSRLSLAPHPLYPDTARGSTAGRRCAESPQIPDGIMLYTIWARLLTEGNRDRREVTMVEPTSESGHDHFPSSRKQAAEAQTCAPADVEVGLPSDFSRICSLISPQATSRVLQMPRSGTCCMCHFSWTEDQKKRALAIEKIIEATFSRLEEAEAVPSSPSSKDSIAGIVNEWDASKRPYSEEEAADKRALQVLQQIDVLTSFRILKKGWHSLERHERLIVDSIIRLTFRSHWLAAHWFRFLESNSLASRKLPHLDRLIWQYRNLYPGLTPALAWAIWDVAQALLSLEGNSKLKNSERFQRYADQCIVSAYKESVLILSLLFGAGSSFLTSIVDEYSAAVEECEYRVMRQGARSWRSVVASGHSSGSTLTLPNGFKLPKVWPCYISFCADVSIASSGGRVLVPGTALIEAYRNSH